MELKGRLVTSMEFKAGVDVFDELLKQRPEKVMDISPLVNDCQLHEGGFGRVGSVISWIYTHEKRQKLAKQRIQKIDEEKKLVEFKVIEGDLMEDFKDFLVTFNMKAKNGINLVTWTFDYEMLNEDVKLPTSLLAYCIDVTKHIEEHYAGKSQATV